MRHATIVVSWPPTAVSQMGFPKRTRSLVSHGVLLAIGLCAFGATPSRSHAQAREILSGEIELFALHPIERRPVAPAFRGGFGAGITALAEVNLHAYVGVLAGAQLFFSVLGNGQLAPWGAGVLGARFHFTPLLNLHTHDGWIDAHYSFGRSGEISAHAFSFGVGYAVGITPSLRIGPFARLYYAPGPSGTSEMVLFFGLNIGLGTNSRVDFRPPPPDYDHDGIADNVDVCPDMPPGDLPDETRPGCPLDPSAMRATFEIRRRTETSTPDPDPSGNSTQQTGTNTSDPTQGTNTNPSGNNSSTNQSGNNSSSQGTQPATHPTLPVAQERLRGLLGRERRAAERRAGVDVAPQSRPVIVPAFELTAAMAMPARMANFGIGAGLALRAEINFAPWLGMTIGGRVSTVTGAQYRDLSTWMAGGATFRFHLTPILALAPEQNDFWFDVGYEFGVFASGGDSHSPSIGIGYELAIGPGFRVGPLARVSWMPGSDGRGPIYVDVGLGVGFGGNARAGAATLDHDFDGVNDAVDECPDRSSGRNEDLSRHGCPAGDADGDGITDNIDMCPDARPGDQGDPERFGCPLADRDGDGVEDARDFCPDEPAPEGTDDALREGCPDRESVAPR